MQFLLDIAATSATFKHKQAVLRQIAVVAN